MGFALMQEGATALHRASEIGSKEIVELVLGRGADVDKRDKVIIILSILQIGCYQGYMHMQICVAVCAHNALNLCCVYTCMYIAIIIIIISS
jgi:ankyrin repeat protein